MKKNLLGVIIVATIALVLTVWAIGARNSMIAQEERVRESWAQVENVYQRRLDLIPNLVETVKGYAAHESETFLKVTEARAKATQTSGPAEANLPDDSSKFEAFQHSQAALGEALARLLVVVENYPELKANQNFIELQAQLEGTENRISVERKKYNEEARSFNVLIRQFPASIMASISHFSPKPYFQSEAGAEKAPKVKF